MSSKPWGIDVSEFQPNVNWAQVKADGATFAIARAAYGLYHPDETFTSHVDGIRAAKLFLGAYLYGLPCQDPAATAKYFLSLLKSVNYDPAPTIEQALASGKDFPPAWDLEATTAEVGSCRDVHGWVHTVLQTTEAAGVRPMIYTYYGWWNDNCGACDYCCSHELWFANYPNHPNPDQIPTVPGAWKTASAWQFTSSATVNGVPGNVDEDWLEVPTTPTPFTEDEVLRIVQVQGNPAQAVTNGLVKRDCGYPADEMWEIQAGLVTDRTVFYISEDEWNRLPNV